MNGYSCAQVPVCKCKNCGNEKGATLPTRKRKLSSEKHTPTPGSSGKLNRVTSSVLFAQLGIKENQTVWTLNETLNLVVCMEKCCDYKMKELTCLYNCVVKEMDQKCSQNRFKTARQVFCKCKNIQSYHGIYNKKVIVEEL